MEKVLWKTTVCGGEVGRVEEGLRDGSSTVLALLPAEFCAVRRFVQSRVAQVGLSSTVAQREFMKVGRDRRGMCQ